MIHLLSFTLLLLSLLVARMAMGDDGMCTQPPKEPDGDCGGGGESSAHKEAFYIDISSTISPSLPSWYSSRTYLFEAHDR